MKTQLWITITTAVATGIVLGALVLTLIMWWGMSSMTLAPHASAGVNGMNPSAANPMMSNMNEMMQRMMGGMMGR